MSPNIEFCGLSVHNYGKFKPDHMSPIRLTGMKFKTMEHKLVSLATVVALWTLVTLLMKLVRKLLKWKFIRDKNYAILAATEYLLQKRSCVV